MTTTEERLERFCKGWRTITLDSGRMRRIEKDEHKEFMLPAIRAANEMYTGSPDAFIRDTVTEVLWLCEPWHFAEDTYPDSARSLAEHLVHNWRDWLPEDGEALSYFDDALELGASTFWDILFDAAFLACSDILGAARSILCADED